MSILGGPCSEILIHESDVSDIISPHIRVWTWAIYSDPLHCTDEETEVFLQQGWERLELGSQRVRGHEDEGLKTCQGSWGRGVEDLVPNLFSLLRVPYCGQRGEGESGMGLNSDGFLTQHTITCSEVRLLWGHRKDLLPVLNIQFEQCWMRFKMHFTPRHSSNTDFSYCMGEVWKETDVCALQTGDHAHKPFLNFLYWKLWTSSQIWTTHLNGSGSYSPERFLVEPGCSNSKCSQNHVPSGWL